jgi:hypothetical protein
MTHAQDDRQALYLRTFFRLLSSWGHQADAFALSPAPIFSTLSRGWPAVEPVSDVTVSVVEKQVSASRLA